MFGMNTPSFYCIDNVTTEDISTSTEAINQEFVFNVFPNPVSDVLQIDCDYNSGEIQLIDSRGVVIYHQTPVEDHIALDIRDYSQGVYYVQLVTSKGKYVRTIVKN